MLFGAASGGAGGAGGAGGGGGGGGGAGRRVKGSGLFYVHSGGGSHG